MVLMRTYFFYCSVRLGVITVAIMALLNSVLQFVYYFAYGKQFMDPVLEFFANDDEKKSNAFMKLSKSWKELYPDYIVVISKYRYVLHALSAMLGIFGAIKLQKWLIVPLAIFEFLNFLEVFHIIVILTIVLRQLITLDLLIAVTLLGSSFLLYLGYNFITCVAFFQIITMVKSTRYRALYGDNLFQPHTVISAEKLTALGYTTQLSLENVHVLLTPNDSEIDVQKHLTKLAAWKLRQQIIAVLPIGDATSKKWWQKQAADVDANNRSFVYAHWQPAELIGEAHKMQAAKQIIRRER